MFFSFYPFSIGLVFSVLYYTEGVLLDIGKSARTGVYFRVERGVCFRFLIRFALRVL